MPANLAVYQPKTRLEDLPKRKRDFIKAYVRLGDAVEAYLDVGYKDSHTKVQKASNLKRELHRFIQEEVTNFSASTDMAILGLKKLRELAENAKSEQVQLSAAKELLERSLPDAPKETTVVHKHENITGEAIDKRIEQLRDQLGLNAIDITPSQVSIS